MAGFTTLATAVSGLRAAQAGLYVTGHNMSNSAIPGYSRQRPDQTEFMQQNIGFNGIGTLQLGLGTDIAQIKQIRDKFIDITYRQEMSKTGFYSVKATVGLEVESILGEMQSDYRVQSVLDDMWLALNELSIYDSGHETRANFISTCVAFVKKANNVAERLYQYQLNLDLQIRDAVQEVNRLITKIASLNDRITDAELANDHANDFRDERNRALDELSRYVNIDYKEMPNGRVDIFAEGNMLLVQNNPNYLSLKYTGPNCSFVEPVFTGVARTEILPCDAPYGSYYSLFNLTGTVSSDQDNDRGLIKGLMVARGYFYPVNYATEPTRNWGPATTMMADPSAYGTAAPAYAAAYSAYQTAYYTWQTNYQSYINGVVSSAPKPPEPPDPSGYTGLDPSYTDEYNRASGEYNAFMKYLTQFPNRQAVNNQYQKEVFNLTQCMIPKIQNEFDTIVHAIIKLVNDTVSPAIESPPGSGTYVRDPDAPHGMDGSQYTEVFVRMYPPYSNRFDPDTGELIPEDPTNQYSLYTIGNIVVNPDMLNSDGYNLLAFMPENADIDDMTLVLGMMDTWKSDFISFRGGTPLSVDNAYRQFVTNIANETRESINFEEEQTVLITQIDNKRQATSGVSLDEEMTNMLKYQHAYNASARMITQIDAMLDRIINQTGRVGL